MSEIDEAIVPSVDIVGTSRFLRGGMTGIPLRRLVATTNSWMPSLVMEPAAAQAETATMVAERQRLMRPPADADLGASEPMASIRPTTEQLMALLSAIPDDVGLPWAISSPPQPEGLRNYASILEDRGIRVLRDDEVIDMGGYVLWKDYDPSCSVVLLHPEDLESVYLPLSVVADRTHADRIHKKLVAHATKPVRVQGLFYNAESGECYHVYPERGARRIPNQIVWVSDLYGNAGAETQTRGLKPIVAERITVATMPRGMRFIYARHLRTAMPRGANPLSRAVARNITERLASMVGPASSSHGVVEFHGQELTSEFFMERRARCRELGEIIRCAENMSSDQVIRTLGSAYDGEFALAGDAIREWNVRCSPGEEIGVQDCGHLANVNDSHGVFGGGTVCDECFEDQYVRCVDTDEYHPRGHVYYHGDEEYYSYPERDGDDSGRVHDYSDNVLRYQKKDTSIKVSPYGEFLMGIELEVVPTERADSAASDTTDNLCSDYAILKHDGSLSRGGFEIVTAPRGLKEHITRFSDWSPYRTLRAWDAGCCGLHVHLSSGAFTQSTLGKFIEFINSPKNDDFIRSIAGRHPSHDKQSLDYCAREGDLYIGNPKKTLAGKNHTRYRMVNTANLQRDEARRLGLQADHYAGRINTVELRIFRASLKKARLLAQIEFAHAAVMFCRWSSMRELDKAHFILWLRQSAGVYPNLAKWFGVKANTQVVIAAPPVVAEAEV